MYVQIKRSPPQQLRFFPQVFLGFVLRDPRRRAPGGELHAAAGCRLVHGGHRGPGGHHSAGAAHADFGGRIDSNMLYGFDIFVPIWMVSTLYEAHMANVARSCHIHKNVRVEYTEQGGIQNFVLN